MSREIKFKYVFQHDECGYILVKIYDLEDFENGTVKKDLLELRRYNHIATLEYTGLKDKNGKEIYQGDIIPYHFQLKQTAVVRYGEYRNPFGDDLHGGHVGFYLDFTDGITRKDLAYWVKVSEVIGNIYENLELLEREENPC